MGIINVSEAKKLILESCITAKIENVSLLEATGSVLAEKINSVVNTPPFDQAAMDGYAFDFDSWDRKSVLTVSGEVQAGNFSSATVKSFETVRIFTGAPLPTGTDTVVMQEKIIVVGKTICIQDNLLVKGSNVRREGSQTIKGELVMQKGQLLTPAAISFLASIGVDKLNVYSKPSVSIIVTGDELMPPGRILSNGQIYESNSFGLTAALNQINISPVSIDIVNDEEAEIIKTITSRLSTDILILTGGVSVGNYDLVPSSLKQCGVVQIFHKVKQKPGKPLYFGKINQTLVFALPGNPAAVLTCFYEYVLPAISRFTQKQYFRRLQMPLASDFRKKPGLTFFLKGKTKYHEVIILNNQESYMMNSFAMADCILELEEDKELYKKGDLVNVSMIV